MHFTGIDHILYSSTSFFSIYDAFMVTIKLRWGNPIIEEWERKTNSSIELFIAKDKAMYERHHAVGYTPDPNGESCVLLMCKRIENIDYEIEVINKMLPEEVIKTERYESRLLMEAIWEYTLVLPELISDNNFSGFMYDALCGLLIKR